MHLVGLAPSPNLRVCALAVGKSSSEAGWSLPVSLGAILPFPYHWHRLGWHRPRQVYRSLHASLIKKSAKFVFSTQTREMLGFLSTLRSRAIVCLIPSPFHCPRLLPRLFFFAPIFLCEGTPWIPPDEAPLPGAEIGPWWVQNLHHGFHSPLIRATEGNWEKWLRFLLFIFFFFFLSYCWFICFWRSITIFPMSWMRRGGKEAAPTPLTIVFSDGMTDVSGPKGKWECVNHGTLLIFSGFLQDCLAYFALAACESSLFCSHWDSSQ